MNHPAELISSPAAMGDEEKRMEMEWNEMGEKDFVLKTPKTTKEVMGVAAASVGPWASSASSVHNGAAAAVVVLKKEISVKGGKALMEKERERERELEGILSQVSESNTSFIVFFLAIFLYSQKWYIKNKSAKMMCFLRFSIAIIGPKFDIKNSHISIHGSNQVMQPKI